MHVATARAISWAVCIFWFAENSLVNSVDGLLFPYLHHQPPCMSQLGIRVDAYDDSFRFDLAVSSGVAEDVRLNGKQAWIPKQFSDSYVQINVTRSVLLTGLQIQGDPESSGRLTAWTLQTSLDCINYKTENYTLDYRSTLQASTVLLKNVEFVTCIILRPTEFKGRSPALRLELLGCVLSERDKCHHTATPVSDEWMADGGRQLSYDHDIVLAWIQAQLDLDIPGDFGEVGIYYSRNCHDWKFYEPLDLNIVSLTSSDQRDRLVTLELNTPVRAKCLRIFPPLAARIREVQTNECSGRLTSRLHDNKSQEKNNMKKFGEDANTYQDEPSCLYQMASQDDAPVLSPDKKPPENLMDIISKGKAEGDSKKHPLEDVKELPKSLMKQPDLTSSPSPIVINTEILSTEFKNDLEQSDINMSTTKSSFSTTSAELISSSHELEISTGSHTGANTEGHEILTVKSEPPYDMLFSGKYERLRNMSLVDELEEIWKENDTFLLEDNGTLFLNTSKPSESDLLQDKRVEVEQNKSLNISPIQTNESVLVPMNTIINETLKDSLQYVVTNNDVNTTTSDKLATNNESTTEIVSSQNLNNNEMQISIHDDIQSSKHNDIQTSKNNDIQTPKHDDNGTSLNSENNNFSNKTDSEALGGFQNVKEVPYHHTNETQAINNNKINSEVNEVTSIFTTASPHLPTTGTNDTEAQSNFKVPEVSSDETDASVISNGINNGLLSDPPYCGIKHQEAGTRRKRIIGGYKNSPGEWPWLVTMYFLPDFDYTKKSGYKHICGASLIAPSWIITAGHCFSEDILKALGNASNWRVMIGMYDLEDDKNTFVQERLISDIIVYPTYNITTAPLINDLALVRLNKPVQTSDMVFPICLDNTDIFYNETQCHVTGWGNLDFNSTGSRFPHSTLLTVLTQETCKHMFDILPDSNAVKPYINISQPVLCARVGPEGQDSCQGDSGGPMMCDIGGYWYQVGVVAAGHGCGNIEIPGLYTRISYFFDWINGTISGYQG